MNFKMPPKNIFNFALFAVAWSCCLLGGSLIAFLVTVLAVWIHLRLVNTRRGEAEMIFLVGLMGTLIDSVLMHLQVTHFPHDTWFVPFWLTCAWFIYASTLNYSLAWLKTCTTLQSLLFGGILGPLVYFISAKLGIVSFSRFTWYSIALLSSTWAYVMWLLPKLAEQITEEREK